MNKVNCRCKVPIRHPEYEGCIGCDKPIFIGEQPEKPAADKPRTAEDGIRYAKYELNGEKILKDGHTMFLKDVVKDLNRKSYLEKEYALFNIRVFEEECDEYDMSGGLACTNRGKFKCNFCKDGVITKSVNSGLAAKGEG